MQYHSNGTSLEQLTRMEAWGWIHTTQNKRELQANKSLQEQVETLQKHTFKKQISYVIKIEQHKINILKIEGIKSRNNKDYKTKSCYWNKWLLYIIKLLESNFIQIEQHKFNILKIESIKPLINKNCKQNVGTWARGQFLHD